MMRDILSRFFGKAAAAGSEPENAAANHDVTVATCALLLEMAKIDDIFSEEELTLLLSILKDKYGLSADQAEELLAAAEAELEESVDYWQFARRINETYSTAEKIEIIENLWRIVFLDGKMNRYEHHLMHKLSNLLRLSQDQLIDAKMKVLYPT